MSSRGRYLVKSIMHARQVLDAFRDPREVLRLREVAARSGLNKGMCFRLLYTLNHCGFLEKVGENNFRLAAQSSGRRYLIGCAGQGQDSSFPHEVLKSLETAVQREHIELLTVDNRCDAKMALHNAEYLVREKPDLIIELQSDEAIAPAIAAKYLDAGIPFIAVDVPHPGASYFGANNYEAGVLGGAHLARWTRKHWDGRADELLLIGLTRGSLPHARIRGVLAGFRETLALPKEIPAISIDGDGEFRTTLERVRKYLRSTRAERILIGTANDLSALGALRAFEEAGRAQDCAIVGQNGAPEARSEMRLPSTRLIGSVAYFPEKYGDGLVSLALSILAGEPVPPTTFINHKLITPANVAELYPADSSRAPNAALG